MSDPRPEGSGDFSIGGRLWPGTSKLIEECGELQQVLGKLLGSRGVTTHWDGTDLEQRLVEEVADVLAAIDLFCELNLEGNGPLAALRSRRAQKLQLFRRWHEQVTTCEDKR